LVAGFENYEPQEQQPLILTFDAQSSLAKALNSADLLKVKGAMVNGIRPDYYSYHTACHYIA